MTETLKGFPPRCWNCGKELSVSNLVHNERGGDSVMCSCGASMTPTLPGQGLVKASKETFEPAPEPTKTAPRKTKTKK